MGLLDGLEKLINEHGSATIIKERLQLAADRFAALERENSLLKKTVQDLKEQPRTVATVPVDVGLTNAGSIDDGNPKLGLVGGFTQRPLRDDFGYGIVMEAVAGPENPREHQHMIAVATEWLPYASGAVRTGWYFHPFFPAPKPGVTYAPQLLYELNSRHAVVFFKLHVSPDSVGYVHVASVSDIPSRLIIQTSSGSSCKGYFSHSEQKMGGNNYRQVATLAFKCNYSVGQRDA